MSKRLYLRFPDEKDSIPKKAKDAFKEDLLPTKFSQLEKFCPHQ